MDDRARRINDVTRRARQNMNPDVRPGQIWADNDPRCAGRTLRVEWTGAARRSARS